METLLAANRVCVEFDTVIALRDVSFTLDGGQLLGLVGPNGAGKTTLLRVLAGLQPPTRGLATIMGRPVLGAEEVVRHHVGFAPDAPPVYEDLTIDQFLRFIGAAYQLDRSEVDERIEFWLEQLWLTEKRHETIKTLSRGMRQRVTLARCFLPRPHVILLDEPLSGLDPAGRIQLRKVLGMLREQGCAMIVSSHILTDLEEVSTHIAIIEHGRILRWTAAHAMHDRADARIRYRLTALDAADAVAARLRGVEGVAEIAVSNGAVEFDYLAEDAAAAALLRRLIEQDLPLTSFHRVRATLEEAYLKSGVKQVD